MHAWQAQRCTCHGAQSRHSQLVWHTSCCAVPSTWFLGGSCCNTEDPTTKQCTSVGLRSLAMSRLYHQHLYCVSAMISKHQCCRLAIAPPSAGCSVYRTSPTMRSFLGAKLPACSNGARSNALPANHCRQPVHPEACCSPDYETTGLPTLHTASCIWHHQDMPSHSAFTSGQTTQSAHMYRTRTRRTSMLSRCYDHHLVTRVLESYAMCFIPAPTCRANTTAKSTLVSCPSTVSRLHS
jgi:hypothetical protein